MFGMNQWPGLRHQLTDHFLVVAEWPTAEYEHSFQESLGNLLQETFYPDTMQQHARQDIREATSSNRKFACEG